MLYELKTTQLLKSDLATVWAFISNPKNLATITPPSMGFYILSDVEEMYQGQIIQYHVKPLLGVRLLWVTEITHVEPLKYFVDEQRFGPYTFWHHKHFVKEVEGGVEMIDIVHYKLPFGLFGKLLAGWFVKKKLAGIFNYRYQVLENLFS